MEKTCKFCNQPIPEGRLKALPGADTCVQHSTASRYKVNVVSSGDPEKGELNQEFEVVRDPNTQKNLELYKNQLGTYR
jgi:hypothetical protein